MGMFQLAVREKLHLRMALVGPSGSGKTLTALKIAQGLAGDGTIAIIDTERGSARRYANLMQFYVVELDHYSPDSYIKAIHAASEEGFKVLIIDSLSHAWNSKGGILEMVDKAAKTMKGNSFVAWGEATPKHNQLIDAILDTKLHIIVTMRSKTEYVLELNANGKTVPRKVGTTPIQRDGVEYEFDITADMDNENTLIVSKSRCMALNGATIARPDSSLGDTLRKWADEGIEPTQRKQSQPVHFSDDAEKMSGWLSGVANKIYKTDSTEGILKRVLTLLDVDNLRGYRDGHDAYNAVYNAYLAALPPATPMNGSAPVEPDAAPAEPVVEQKADSGKKESPFKDVKVEPPILKLYVGGQHLSIGDVVTDAGMGTGKAADQWLIVEIGELRPSDDTFLSPHREAQLRNVKTDEVKAWVFDKISNVTEPVVGGPKLAAVKENPTLAVKSAVSGRWNWQPQQAEPEGVG